MQTHCDICCGTYPNSKHNFEECYSLDIEWDIERIDFLERYFIKINNKIREIFRRTRRRRVPFDILDCGTNLKCMEICLLIKQIQMKYGEIWQYVLGNYRHFEDLKVGHETGLDIMSTFRKVIIELKNRYNTDNASSRKSNLDKLVEFKKKNKDYTVIYGIVNDTTLEGKISDIIHNGEIIKKYTGMKLFQYILGYDAGCIINRVKIMVALHSPKV